MPLCCFAKRAEVQYKTALSDADFIYLVLSWTIIVIQLPLFFNQDIEQALIVPEKKKTVKTYKITINLHKYVCRWLSEKCLEFKMHSFCML